MSTNGTAAYMQKQVGLNELMELINAVRRLLAKMHTSMPVEVIACTNDGNVSPVGTVTLKVLVNQVDSYGNTVSAGAMLYNVPYSRIQGGANAVICDPVEGDIGCAVFAERDISIVMANYGPGNPGSNRRNHLSDAMFIGAFPNVVPTQYIQFLPNGGGINILSPMAINASVGDNVTIQMSTTEIQMTVDDTQYSMTSSAIQAMAGGCGFTITSAGTAFVGPVTGTQTADFTGEGTFNGHTVSNHDHVVTGVQAGSATVTTQKPSG